MPDFDVIVIGSGFGGAVAVVPSGRGGLPRARARARPALAPEQLSAQARTIRGSGTIGNPVTRHGWFDFRIFPQHDGRAGRRRRRRLARLRQHLGRRQAGHVRRAGGPPRSPSATLAPHYADSRPDARRAARPADAVAASGRKLVQRGGEQGRLGDTLPPLELAVQLRRGLALPAAGSARDRAARRQHQRHGAKQGTCVHLGNCDIGCDVNARNTLDLNYLARRRDARRGDPAAAPRPAASSRSPAATRCTSSEIRGGALRPGSATARVVVRRRRLARIDGAAAAIACARQTLPNAQRRGSAWAGAATATS